MAADEISTALTSLKVVVEIAKSILNMSKDTHLKEKIIKLHDAILALQSRILSVQSEYGKLVEVKNQLEKKLVEYEDWDKTKSQYELKAVALGVFVFVPKKGDEFAEPEHWLCTNCFNERMKSILQLSKDVISGRYYFCPKCKNEICIPSDKPPGDRVKMREFV